MKRRDEMPLYVKPCPDCGGYGGGCVACERCGGSGLVRMSAEERDEADEATRDMYPPKEAGDE